MLRLLSISISQIRTGSIRACSIRAGSIRTAAPRGILIRTAAPRAILIFTGLLFIVGFRCPVAAQATIGTQDARLRSPDHSSLAELLPRESNLSYTIRRGSVLYHSSDSTKPYLHLKFREPVEVIRSDARWSRVRTLDGANGLVLSADLSNIWIRISKSSQTVYVYRGENLIRRYPADLGYNFFSDKLRRGSQAEPDQWRTPQGEFFVAARNPRSAFHRAFVLNYPSAEDAERGLKSGLISEDEYARIVSSEKEYRAPPMNTGLGGFIEIHGNGTGARNNWTQGCIAIGDSQIDQLWNLVHVGTPVLIEP